MPRPKKPKGPPPFEDLPENLRRAVVRIMAKYNIGYMEALEKLAILADIGSREFTKEVKKRVEREYKSRFMKQLNSARASINKKARARAHFSELE